MLTADAPRVRIESQCSTGDEGPSDRRSIQFRGLTKAELDALESFQAGTAWMRVNEGRIEWLPMFKAPPDPADDPLMPDQMSKWPDVPAGERPRFNVSERGQDLWSPSLQMAHIGAGRPRWTAKDVAAEYRKITSYGFECMRSRRGQNGKYWERWFLPYLEAAEGALGRHLRYVCDKCGRRPEPDDTGAAEGTKHGLALWDYRWDTCGGTWQRSKYEANANGKTRTAIDFLIANVSFGTLDVMAQRARITFD